jgi:hypothetical protein
MNLVGEPPNPVSQKTWLFKIAFEAAAPTLIFKTKDPEGIKALHWLRKEILFKNIPLMGNIYAAASDGAEHPKLDGQQFIKNQMVFELQNDQKMPKTLLILKNLFCSLLPNQGQNHFTKPHQGFKPEVIFECGPYEPRHKLEIFQSSLIYALVAFQIMREEDYPDYCKHQFILSRLMKV